MPYMVQTLDAVLTRAKIHYVSAVKTTHVHNEHTDLLVY